MRTDKIVKVLIRASSGTDVFLGGKILELQNKDVLTFAFLFLYICIRKYSLFYKRITKSFLCMSGHLRTLKSVMSAVNILEPLWDRDDRVLTIRMEILFREKLYTRIVVKFCKE